MARPKVTAERKPKGPLRKTARIAKPAKPAVPSGRSRWRERREVLLKMAREKMERGRRRREENRLHGYCKSKFKDLGLDPCIIDPEVYCLVRCLVREVHDIVDFEDFEESLPPNARDLDRRGIHYFVKLKLVNFFEVGDRLNFL